MVGRIGTQGAIKEFELYDPKGEGRHFIVIAEYLDNEWISQCRYCRKLRCLVINPETKEWKCKLCNRSGHKKEKKETEILNKYQEERQAKPKKRGILEKEYIYLDEKREELFRCRRYNNPKGFSQGYYEGKKWIGNIKGVRRVLYWLPELIKGKDPVILVEGEKNVDELRKWDLTATCNPMGAMKWRVQEKEYNPFLKDREVVIIPDQNDEDQAGKKHLNQVGKSLYGIAKTFKVLWLPGADDIKGYDFCDWKTKDKNNTLEKFLILLSETKEWKPEKKEEPKKKKKALKSITLEELLDTFKKWLELEETEYIEVILATILSNQLLGDPVWLFVIGASGASKTEILRSFQEIESIYTTSKLTAQSLVSGKVFKDSNFDPSLLPRLDGKTLILKDFTTILSMRAEDKQIIFSDLREAYDGYLEKNFGNIGKKRFDAHFTIIAGVTPVLDKFTAMQQQLGERFLKLRLSEKETETKIEKAVDNLEVQTAMREELNTATQRFFAQTFKLKQVKIPQEIKNLIIKLAQYTASLRTAVSRNPYNRNILDYIPEEEVGTRLGIQLAKLGKALSAIRNKKEITMSELKILGRIAKDTIPKKVLVLVDCLSNEPYGLTTSEIREKTGIENETCRYALKDLQVLGLVISKTIKGKGNPINWKVTEKFEKLITVL